MKTLLCFLLLASLLLCCRPAFCQTALNASPEDPVYSAIDVFISHGLVKDVIIGQRPYSRLEVARILKVARKSLEEIREPKGDLGLDDFNRHISRIRYLDGLLSYYEKEYPREIAGMKNSIDVELLPRFDLSLIYNSSKPRVIPATNGQGTIDAVVTSFDQNDQGITYVDGANTFLSTQHDFYLSKYVAMTVQPRFEFLSPVDGDTEVYAHIHRLYAKSGYRNFEFEIGRDNLLWGQGEYGGLMISSNARPLDMIKLSNPYPWRAPWIFKYLGPMKWTFFVSNLGPEREFPYAYFYGLKWTLKPSQYFELGLSHTLIMGGRGAPNVKWWEPVAELLPFHKWGRNMAYGDIANNAWGFFDFRITIPPLRNSVLYYDGYIEDSIVRAFSFPDNLLNQMGFVVGWYSPRISYKGDLALRVEYHHTPPLAYKHGRWTSGYTLNRRVIGDALGPTADGIYATVYWRPRPKFLARLDFGYEDYDSSTYTTETNAEGGGERILKEVAGPHERRFRSVFGIDWLKNRRFGLKFSAGYERIQNWNFEAGRSANNVLLGANLSLHFDEFNFESN